MSNWHVGQKVVCVDAEGVDEYITNGRTYIVEEVRFCCSANPTLGLGIKSPLPCLCTWCGKLHPSDQIGFGSTRFRPLQEQDLSSELALKEVERIGEIRREQEVEYQEA